jgi:O-antigen/teichoic acid export membrane protein
LRNVSVQAELPLEERDQHFATTHLSADLSRRSVRGGVVTLASQLLTFTLQLGSTMVLARLLAPSDFGLIVMVTAVTGFVANFQDMGLSVATVQRARVTHRQASTLFWINVAVSLGLVALVALLAPLLARIYGEPRLTAITLVMSGVFLMGGIAAQHIGLLRRQMRFHALAAINVTALAVGVFTAITLAWFGAGYWALVAMTLAQTGTVSAMSIGLSGWRPGLPRRRTGVRSMLAFGANFTGYNLLNYIGRHADKLLIGWYWGPAPTGLYSRAYALLLLPMSQINDPLTGIAVPVLSRLQDDPARYRTYYYRAISMVSYLTVPMIVLMAVLAEDLVAFFLGGQWTAAADIFLFLALAALFQPILYTAGWVWTSLGRTNELLRWSMLTAPAFVLSFAVGLPWGPKGVALAYAVCVNAVTPVGLAWCYRGTQMTLAGAVRAVWRPFLLSGLMGSAAFVSRLQLDNASAAGRLVASSAAALLVGALCVAVWPSARRDVLDALSYVRSARPETPASTG